MDEVDELDAYLDSQSGPTEGEAVKFEHMMMEKIAVNPARRKIIRTIGIFGKSREEIQKEVGLNDLLFNFNMDFLLREGFIRLEDGIYRLTSSGIAMHDSCC